MHQEDHEEAVAWFDKAQPMFDQEGLENLVDSNSFGDLFVSMGVSYWETGDKDTAVRLTEVGTDLMQNAVQSGSLELGGSFDSLRQSYGHVHRSGRPAAGKALRRHAGQSGEGGINDAVTRFFSASGIERCVICPSLSSAVESSTIPKRPKQWLSRSDAGRQSFGFEPGSPSRIQASFSATCFMLLPPSTK